MTKLVDGKLKIAPVASDLAVADVGEIRIVDDKPDGLHRFEKGALSLLIGGIVLIVLVSLLTSCAKAPAHFDAKLPDGATFSYRNEKDLTLDRTITRTDGTRETWHIVSSASPVIDSKGVATSSVVDSSAAIVQGAVAGAVTAAIAGAVPLPTRRAVAAPEVIEGETP